MKTDLYGKSWNDQSFLELNLTGQLTVLEQILVTAVGGGVLSRPLWARFGQHLTAPLKQLAGYFLNFM